MLHWRWVMVGVRRMMVAFGLAALAGTPVVRGHVIGEIVLTVGHSAAGQLKIVTELDEAVVMQASPFPEVPGYFGSDPAFHSVIGDDVAGDFYELSPAASVRFVLLGKDPGMEVFRDNG